MLHEMRLVLKSSESERIAVNEMIKAQDLATDDSSDARTSLNERDKASAPSRDKTLSPSDENSVRHSMETLLSMLDTASEYVNRVVYGKMPADDDVGRRIADTLSSVPRVRLEVFDRMFGDSLQDLLMVTYLSNITRTQLTIAEKLNRYNYRQHLSSR